MDYMPNPPAWRLALDTGGAFTTACVYNEKSNKFFNIRIPSNPKEPVLSNREILNEITRDNSLLPEDIIFIIQGSNLTCNAIKDIPASNVALLVTRG